MKTHCRCRKCRTRRVLKRQPAEYRNRKICPKCKARNEYGAASCDECKSCLSMQPKCSNCGARDFAADRWMNERKTVTCHCDGYLFRHQLGSTHCKFLKSGEYRDGPIITLPGIDLGF